MDYFKQIKKGNSSYSDEQVSTGPSETWFIYTLADPREPNLVRYVGVTNDPQRRLREHRNRAATGEDKTYCGNWKRMLLMDNVRPILTIIDQGTGDAWMLAEMRWVAHFRAQVGDRLCNLTEGGVGTRGHICTIETRAKIRSIHLGMKASDEARESMSRAQTGRKASMVTREKQRQVHRGRPKSAEHKAKISSALTGNRNGFGRKDNAEVKARRGAAVKEAWAHRKAIALESI